MTALSASATRCTTCGLGLPLGGIVSDRSGFGDLSPRAFREAVLRLGLPHARIGRRMLVRLDDLLSALGLAPRADVPRPLETREAARLRLIASITAGSRRERVTT